MMLQLCAMPMAHYDNVVWVPMPTMHPKNWLLVVETADFSQSAGTMHGAPPHGVVSACALCGVALCGVACEDLGSWCLKLEGWS